MGFFEEANRQQAINSSQTAPDSISLILPTLLVLATITVAVIVTIRLAKRYNATGTAKHNKQFYLKMKSKPSWRLMNVIYWLLLTLLTLILVFKPSEYPEQSTFGWGVLVAAVAYPGYLLLRRVLVYIFNPKKD